MSPSDALKCLHTAIAASEFMAEKRPGIETVQSRSHFPDTLAYLEGLLGGAASETEYTVTYNVGSGTGTVAAVTVPAGTMIALNDGSGITPPSGKHFIGWDTNSSSTTADLTGSYIVNASVTLYAIYANN